MTSEEDMQGSTQGSTGKEKRNTQDYYEEARADFDEDHTRTLADIMSSDEEEERFGDRARADSARTVSYISDHETQNDNSDYCRFRKRQVKELSKILAKEMIARANKKALQLMNSKDMDSHDIPKASREKDSGASGARPRDNHKNVSEDLL